MRGVGAARRRSRPIRDAASRLDLLLGIGPRTAADQLRDERRARAREDAASDGVYLRMWTEAAAAVGAEIDEEPSGFLRITRNGVWTRVWRQWVQLDDAVTIRAALDRTFVHAALAGAGIPVPANITVPVSDLGAARDMVRGGPVVVKPASGTGGGRGATASVRTESQLERAALLASRHDGLLVVEAKAEGDVYRLLFLEGELLDVVRRLPPSVTGDGALTIRELVRRENRRRLAAGGEAGLPLITPNLDMLFTLEHAGLRLGSVPARDERVAVKTVTNQSGPNDNVTVREAPSPDLVDEARRAADALGVRLAGVDVITTSLETSLRESGGVVIEVNGGPGLHHHYHVENRDAATRVCIPVLERLLSADVPARR